MTTAPDASRRQRFALSRRAIQKQSLWVGALAGVLALLASRPEVELPAPALAQGSSADPVRVGGSEAAVPAAPSLPLFLSETGLYLPGTLEVDPRNLSYAPQYPLWSDGAEKRRFVRLPDGASIDAANPDQFAFPAGTKFWKEFRFERRIETRFMELGADGEWSYASYIWNAEGSDAKRAPERGARSVYPLGAGLGHDVPNTSDCRACHEGRPERVLGFNALQLSHDPDPLAPHREAPRAGDVNLTELVQRGLLVGLSPALLEQPPRIEAASATERAALGYLFGNCSGCHNARGPLAELDLDFDYPLLARAESSPALASSVRRVSHYQPPGASAALRIAPGDAQVSTVLWRLRSRAPSAQMPPLGTKLSDAAAVRLIERWIDEEL